VLPLLGPPDAGMTLEEIRKRIEKFVDEDPYPRFIGYYAAYDWVVFCQLFGRMVDLPAKFPQYCIDLKQVLDMHRLSLVVRPALSAGDHDRVCLYNDDSKWLGRVETEASNTCRAHFERVHEDSSSATPKNWKHHALYDAHVGACAFQLARQVCPCFSSSS
jgi:hypothetical protein